MLKLILILISTFAVVFCLNLAKVITKSGEIHGYERIIDGNSVNEYLGIPYAEPPIKDLRFKKPLPVKPWKEPFNATEWPNPCFQRYNNNSSEDCLYLNIFAPKSKSNELQGVMFWIHGGGFLYGSSSLEIYDAAYLAAKGDIIIVTINYRLSTFGFLYTGTDDAPGNAGLYDQALALKWVKDNIEHFGGNPNEITIFGQSAGSYSVSLHLLSPITRNLFKNAIMMSGSALTRLAGEDPNIAKHNWVIAAKVAGCGDGVNFTSSSIKCLKELDPNKLAPMPQTKQLITEPEPIISLAVYGNEFLPKRPIIMLKDGDFKVNTTLLMGTTDDEGSFYLTNRDPIKYSNTNPTNITSSEAYHELKSMAQTFITNIPVNTDDVTKVYLSEVPEDDQDFLRRQLGVALGDFYILCRTIQFSKTLYENDKHSKIFQYYYTRKPLVAENCGKWKGTCHESDLIPLFGYPFRKRQMFSDDDRNHSEEFMNTIIHFAKKGYPPSMDGIKWSNYYTINGETVSPYYEFSHHKKQNGNFANNVKHVECDILWKKYIES